VRHAEPADYIIKVLDSWWDGRHMSDMLPKLFFEHFRPTRFVAECNDNILGFIVGFVSQTSSDEAYIHFVGVHPDFRKGGLGRTLYGRFFNATSKLGCRVVRCVTSPVNRAPISFHQRMGFVVEPGSKLWTAFQCLKIMTEWVRTVYCSRNAKRAQQGTPGDILWGWHRKSGGTSAQSAAGS